jgi:protein CpxP
MKITTRLLSALILAGTAGSFVRAADPAPATPEDLRDSHNAAAVEHEAQQAQVAAPLPSADHGPRRDPAKMRAHRLQMLDEKLHLTPAQKDQIKAIWAKAEEQGKALRADATLDRDDRREKMGDIMKDSRAQVRGTLTPDQQKTFDALPPEGRGGRGPRPAGGDKPADVPPAKP